MTAPRAAAFLDRDGTINLDTGYVASPEEVVLLAGAGAAIARLNAAGIPVVVVTNQSGIARGLYGESDFEAVNRRLGELLAADGAHVDATYHCPHAPDAGCECRKPGLLLFRRAADELGLDLAKSWYIGDRERDVAPATAFGGRSVLVPSPDTQPEEIERARASGALATDLRDAMTRVLAALSPPLTPRPDGD